MANAWTFRSVTMLTDSPEDDATALDLEEAFEPAEVAGKDRNVPRRPGMIVRPRFPKRRTLTARGRVVGIGATPTARWAAWRVATDAMFAVMDRSLDPGQVVVYAPYLGLATDKTLTARCVRVTPGAINGGSDPAQRWSFELECVTDPPNWLGYPTATPGTANLTLTTFAPTVSTPRLVTPGVVALTITRFAPTVTSSG